MNGQLIIGAALSCAAAVVAGAILKIRLRRDPRPDGWCRKHEAQAELKGVRVGAAEPNWYCMYGSHCVNRRGGEYEPSKSERTAALAVLGGVAYWLARRK